MKKFVFSDESGFVGAFEEYENNEFNDYCIFTEAEMIEVIKQVNQKLDFTPTLVQGEDDGIPDTPTLCFTLDEVKEAVLELTDNERVAKDFPNYREEILACPSMKEIDEHDVLVNWETYNSMVRFFFL